MDEQTVAAYTAAAKERAADFQTLGAQNEAVERALKLAGNPSAPRVLEIGCGSGRDTEVMVSQGCQYIGFDSSQGMLRLGTEARATRRFVC